MQFENGYLIVTVLETNTERPISGASVIVRGDDFEDTFITDINGKTETIPLRAPARIYSLTPQTEVRPYSVYQVEVTSPGYETSIINGVQIFPGVTSLQNVYLSPRVSLFTTFAVEVEAPNITNIPPHSLWEKRENERNIINNSDIRVLPEIIVPEYIVVHDGAPSSTSATNYIVRFPDYIKNVASSEIYSTWPTEAIKANIYAIISFTLNRLYTEWYKSQGYDFTITSLPRYDQTYINNRTIFQNISNIVDEIFRFYIREQNKNFPYFAQYNDGINTNNPGWLSQWGAKSLADQGFSALEILRRYYPSNIVLDEAKEMVGLPTSFPGYNLSVGSCGEPVRLIQNMINTINNNYPGIPKIVPADGKFGNNTKVSIETFQSVFNFPITGVVDINTWYRISYIYTAVTKMAQGR